jgi:cardiolipin synthase
MKKRSVFNLPNLLSLLRLAMIPLLLWLYLDRGAYLLTAAVVVLSGATDVVDGIIARRYDLITDLGKALDPIADKLTQIAMLYCLGTSFPEIRILLGILIVKEVITGVMSLISIGKTGRVDGAQWHGKLTTVLLYAMIVDRIVPWLFSVLLTLACAGMMVFSMVMYWKRNRDSIREAP